MILLGFFYTIHFLLSGSPWSPGIRTKGLCSYCWAYLGEKNNRVVRSQAMMDLGTFWYLQACSLTVSVLGFYCWFKDDVL